MSDPRGSFTEALARREAFLVGAILALAVALRLPELFGWWPNPDEGIYYGVVTREGFGAALGEALATSHPPLYFLVLRAVGWVSTDFVALRSVAFLSGCAAVYVFVLLGREVGGGGRAGRLAGLLAGLLLAVSPRAVVLSQVIRPYMFLVLLLAAATLLLLRYLKAPSARLLVGYGACALLAALVHYSSVFALGALGILTLVDGVRRGTGRPEWQRLLAVQAVPALTLAGLYFGHLRGIAEGPLGDHALEGWLAPYMIDSPIDVWLGFVGFHAMLAGDAWAAPAALVTLAAAVWAFRAAGASPVLILAAAAVSLAVVGAAAQVYPFGPTRHTAWLLVFVIPLVAAGAAALLTSPRARLAWGISLAAALILGGRALAPVLDPEERPTEISEHVLREDAVAAMAEVLDPSGEPDVVLMSTETWEQLTPLYPEERAAIEASPDGQLRHFAWGDRDVVVLPTRDFVARPDQLAMVNHLYTGARLAELTFGVTVPRNGQPVLVLSGGWLSQGMLDLREMANRGAPLGTTTSVPGLIALHLDFDAYERALGVTTP